MEKPQTKPNYNFPRKKIIIEEFSVKDTDIPTGTLIHHLKEPYEVAITSAKINSDGYLVAKGGGFDEGSGVTVEVEMFPRMDGTLGVGAKIDIGHEEIGFNYYPQQMTANIVKEK